MRRDRAGSGEGPKRRVRSLATVPDFHTEIMGERASGAGSVALRAFAFAASFLLALALAWALRGLVDIASFAFAGAVAVLFFLSVQVASQWEKVVVLRMGRLHRVVGPGPFLVIPFFESVAMRVDDRVRVTTFGAEETLTSDLVPLDVDAVLFWMVWDARAACTEVGDFTRAVSMAAQTMLRDAIGRGGVAEVAIRREQLDRELKEALAEMVSPWGITVIDVKVRDIVVPTDLQAVMSLEAQAEQRKKARITLLEAEQYIADVVRSAGESYGDSETALRLRMMHLLSESVRDAGGTVVVPSSFSEGLNDVFPDSFK